LDWTARQQEILRLAECQLFFVGGAPRSGTTWLQLLLDSHPEVCCRSEGLFQQHLADPLDGLMAKRREALTAKNAVLFGDGDGYPLPQPEDTDALFGTAILLALQRQCAGTAPRAVGEKTPENVFLFPRLKRLFPGAKFLGVARDPRDLLASAWHFFHKARADQDETSAKLALLESAFPSLQQGARAMLALAEEFPADCLIVTYERLHKEPASTATRLFRFLGVSDDEAVVADCVARTSFSALSGGRAAGVTQEGSFFRKGVVGDWPSTLSPEMNAMILRELGWMFRYFGWEP
jgi:hypothetical protein